MECVHESLKRGAALAAVGICQVQQSRPGSDHGQDDLVGTGKPELPVLFGSVGGTHIGQVSGDAGARQREVVVDVAELGEGCHDHVQTDARRFPEKDTKS